MAKSSKHTYSFICLLFYMWSENVKNLPKKKKKLLKFTFYIKDFTFL